MSIKIVTDSTCDLPQSVIEALGISVVPLFINIGEQGFLDGVELTREEFYTRLPAYSPYPTTGTPGPETFQKVYERLADEGASQVLSIHIATKLSATVDVARVGAGMVSKIPVTVFDSRQLSLGTGFLVETAAQAAIEGRNITDILALLEDQIARTHVAAALDTLEYMRRSGRLNNIVAGLGSLLQLKPLLKMYDGQPASEQVRTRAAALRRLLQLIEERAPLERVGLVHTHARTEVEAFRQKIESLLPPGDTFVMEITPVIGSHIGPGVVGFVCVEARK